MLDRFIHDELRNDMREYENGDYVLYEDYKELEVENARLREVLRLHDTVIDELWEACDSNRHLEELIRDAWEKYKEVIGND